ncbi:hypothetical protein MKZ38_009176 [Zalerion maritima]|uniref:C3H1-type domain-containing protein n=1 Tax=Zalerion maritima TaxID=339359 RepID=A0AAD5RTJ0_9PEZI|nr:hypothetical protein MKZ38_009176 [Zalerion maritima]
MTMSSSTSSTLSQYTAIGTPFGIVRPPSSLTSCNSFSATNSPRPTAVAIGAQQYNQRQLHHQGSSNSNTANTMDSSSEPNVQPPFDDFLRRFDDVSRQSQKSESLIKDLLAYAHSLSLHFERETNRLTEEIRVHQLDLADSKDSRRTLQKRLKEIENRQGSLAHENDALKNRNPYVVILIDGDGLIFRESLVRQGIEGGKLAAYAFKSSIAAQLGPRADEVEIICTIYANLYSLSQAMRRDGSIEHHNEIKDFMLGFTQAKATFNFVDVGHGKERADAKIQDTARFHSKNSNCRHIFLGTSHDAGYAPFLDEFCRDDVNKKRTVLLEGSPMVNEIARIGIEKLKIENMFKSEKLGCRRTSCNQIIAPGGEQYSPPLMHPSPILTNSVAGGPQPSQVPQPPRPLSQQQEAASQRKPTPPPTLTLPIKIKPANARQNTPATKKIIPPPQKPWNPGRRGLDPFLNVNQTVLDAIKRRRDSDKLCNNHYLRGPCAKAGECCFEHSYRPNKEEINVIAFLARLNPCTNGQDCEVEDCIYGHHVSILLLSLLCPSVKN